MKILNEKVINSKEFIQFQSMIVKHYNENETEVSYEDFKKTLSEFIMVIMESYLEDTEYNKDKCFFEIEVALFYFICYTINNYKEVF